MTAWSVTGVGVVQPEGRLDNWVGAGVARGTRQLELRKLELCGLRMAAKHRSWEGPKVELS